MIGILLDQHHGQQARAGKAAGNRMERRRRLTDLLARAAAELLPHMLGHEPLPRNDVESLGDILADLRQLRAAAAGTRRRRRMNDAPARQIGGKVAAHSLLPREAPHRDGGGLRPGLILALRCRQLLELQLHLVEQPLAALRARTELVALHLGDHQLQVLDQRLGAQQPGTRLDQRRLQRFGVFGKGIFSRRHATTESQSRVIRRLNPAR